MNLLRRLRQSLRRKLSSSLSATRRGSLLRTLDQLEDRTVPSGFRSMDGTNNNVYHSLWGSAGIDLLRTTAASYADGVDDPTLGSPTRPSARVVSNTIADQGEASVLNERMMSAMIYAWGQFLDHDLDLTNGANPAEAFNISVPAGDPYFDPTNMGDRVIHLNRSAYNTSGVIDAAHPRQQKNTVTAWIDASQVYGSDTATANKLRTLVGGRLKTSAGDDGSVGTGDDMLPVNNLATFPDGTLPMANDAHIVPDNELFAAGDVRANENIELLSLHTLFVREHNRIARQIQHDHPSYSDETIYQLARAQVIGEIEAITYREWLPALLGPGTIPNYQGYNRNVNPGIANEFSTAAFRLGHSLLGDDVEFLSNSGLEVAEEIPLSEAFFNPPALTETGIDPVLKYLATDVAQELDNTIVNSVRNFLFGPPGAGGFDLASLNIQRGRDHGLANYNATRVAYGLPAVTSFAQITSDTVVQAKLESLYGNVNNIDLWVGALAEDHVSGGSVGPLVRRVLVDQFIRLRDGDSFWYQRTFSGSTLYAIDHTTLSSVIRRNTGLSNLQSNAFFFRASISGQVFNDLDRDGRRDFGEPGLAGRTVQLIDALENEVVGETVTDSSGRYRFGTLTDLGPGRFRIREVMPAGWVLTSQNPPVISITRGDINVSGVNFGNATVIPGPYFSDGGSGTSTGSTGSNVAMAVDDTAGSDDLTTFSPV